MSKRNPNKLTLEGPGGLRIVLDKTQVFKDDPGQGTPAMVHLFSASSTYWCASSEGELDDGGRGMRKLTPSQCRWLNDQEDAVTEFLYPPEKPDPTANVVLVEDERVADGVVGFLRKRGPSLALGYKHVQLANGNYSVVWKKGDQRLTEGQMREARGMVSILIEGVMLGEELKQKETTK